MPSRRSSSRAATEEFSRIAWLERLFALGHSGDSVLIGIGDDAAVLRPPRQPLVWTTDACVQDVHFKLEWLSAEDLGWRSYNAAVSDLAAMGALPIGALSSLALPPDVDQKLWRGVARGQARAAKQLECPVIGGNLTRASEISIHTTAIGQAKHPLLRDGAQVGDEIWLVGAIGAAAAGLSVLMRVQESKWDTSMQACVKDWRRPKARLKEGLALSGRAHSAIDVSDGLASDARHIAEASNVALTLHSQALQSSIARRVKSVASSLGCSALDWALTGGEDYALLATGPSTRRPPFARVVGVVERGSGAWLATDGGKHPIEGGFDHFA